MLGVQTGNWFKVNDLPVTVSGVGQNVFTCTHRKLVYMNGEDVEPIPITAELLKDKCMFKEQHGAFEHPEENFALKQSYPGLWQLYIKINELAYPYAEPKEYLHQIQNLFYSLFHKELEIDL